MKKENNPQKYKDTGLLLGRLVRGLQWEPKWPTKVIFLESKQNRRTRGI